MNPRVTIISLIYRSPEYAVGLYKNLLKFTPSILSGETDFYFVANNANYRTIKALKKNKIPFIEFNQPVLSARQHFELGYATPEYIGRVYKGYNFGLENCKTPLVVLINSDMIFSPNWLENLMALEDGRKIVSCTIVERNHPKFGVFPGAIENNFGSSFKNFKIRKWENFLLESLNENQPLTGGGYMPAIFRTSWFKDISFYPEGNIRKPNAPYSEVFMYGDEYLFEKFSALGIQHITSSNSYCYHFKEGERATSFFPKLQNYLSFIRKWIRRKILPKRTKLSSI